MGQHWTGCVHVHLVMVLTWWDCWSVLIAQWAKSLTRCWGTCRTGCPEFTISDTRGMPIFVMVRCLTFLWVDRLTSQSWVMWTLASFEVTVNYAIPFRVSSYGFKVESGCQRRWAGDWWPSKWSVVGEWARMWCVHTTARCKGVLSIGFWLMVALLCTGMTEVLVFLRFVLLQTVKWPAGTCGGPRCSCNVLCWQVGDYKLWWLHSTSLQQLYYVLASKFDSPNCQPLPPHDIWVGPMFVFHFAWAGLMGRLGQCMSPWGCGHELRLQLWRVVVMTTGWMWSGKAIWL